MVKVFLPRRNKEQILALQPESKYRLNNLTVKINKKVVPAAERVKRIYYTEWAIFTPEV